MNTGKETQVNGVVEEEDAAMNEVPKSDSNANLANNVSKGAIPKTKTLVAKKQNNTSKPGKLNNNIEEMSTLNSDAPRMNGLVNGVCSNFIEYNSDYLQASSSTQSEPISCQPKDESSSDETDLLSVSDDGCIYTYKGDHVADLPSSFYRLDIPQDIQEPTTSPIDRNETSSPEMDYLEMDFDPGIDKDADSISDNEVVLEKEPIPSTSMYIEPVPSTSKIKEDSLSSPSTSNLKLDNLQMFHSVNTTNKVTNNVQNTYGLNNKLEDYHKVRNAPAKNTEQVEEIVGIYFKTNPLPKTDDREMPWSCTLSQRTKSLNFQISKRCHCSKGELVSPNENVPPLKKANVPSAVTTDVLETIEPIMIWNKEDAYLKQIMQIGPSACGATAVLNVLNALRFPVPSIEKVRECVNTRLRHNESPLTDYLLSRSVAGTTHEDLIEGLSKISNGSIYARFFPMYPERLVNLYSWLSFWIKNGAIPIATLNLQRCLGTIPDAWHHQMIYGVDSDGIHLTNPLESVAAGLLWPQLCSESVLLVRRDDVISRWNFRTDLPELMRINDIRWRRINVVGQVANMIHESGRELRPGFTNTSHIRVPASYSSGITLATTTNSPAYTLLLDAPELPLLYPYDYITPFSYSSF